MNGPWELVFHSEAVEVMLSARLRDKRLIEKALCALASHPYREPDYQEKDDTGRPLSVMLVGRWAVVYWLDQLVREIRIVKVEEAGS